VIASRVSVADLGLSLVSKLFVAQATRTKRLFAPNFCAALCQFCAVEFLVADWNSRRN